MREGRRHRLAKSRLAGWLRSAIKRGTWDLHPACSVRTEYPLAYGRSGMLMLHDLYGRRTPRTRELQRWGFHAPWRLDVVLVEPGNIIAGFEVQSCFGCSAAKCEALERMWFPTVEIDAEWIVAQKGMPASWEPGVLGHFGAKS